VNLEARMTREPRLDPGMFVGGVVVGDQVDLQSRWNLQTASPASGVSFLSHLDRNVRRRTPRIENPNGTKREKQDSCLNSQYGLDKKRASVYLFTPRCECPVAKTDH